MEKLRVCVLVFCAACIVAGLAETLSSARKRFPVIKFVCTLYIVSVAFLPLAAGETQLWSFSAPESARAVETPDTRRMALTAAQKTLSDETAAALRSAGIDCVSVRVTLGEQAGAAVVQSVVVTLPGGADEDGAARVVAQTLGEQTPVEVIREGM